MQTTIPCGTPVGVYLTQYPCPLPCPIPYPSCPPTTCVTCLPEKQCVGIQPDLGYVIDVHEMARNSPYFRRVLFTQPDGIQLVIVQLAPEQNLGQEVNAQMDIIVRVEGGTGLARIGNNYFEIMNGALLIVPRGLIHDIQNTGEDILSLSILYTKPLLIPGQVEECKPCTQPMNTLPVFQICNS